jgi:hypothetical protein
MVPHLVTALNGPLLELERRVLDTRTAIERTEERAERAT